MAGKKKASEIGSRFRNVAMRERKGSQEEGMGEAPPGAPPTGPRELGGAPPAHTRFEPGGEVGLGPQTAGRLYGVARQKGVGRKAKVGLRPGTGRHRFTLDLDGVQHRYLKQLALDAQTDMASVVRVLIMSLEEDPVLRNEVAMRARGDDSASVYGAGR
ncbi:MAG: hypothetical protein ACJ73Y_11075 [Rubrobacteraceae bacterium]